MNTTTNSRPLTSPPDYIPSRPGGEPLSNAPRRSPAPQKRRKQSDTTPDGYLLQQADSIEKKVKECEEELVRLWVTIIRRQRADGVNISDSVGVFSPNGTGRWLDVSATNLRPLNIVAPAIKSNTSTVTQAGVALDVKPATSEHKGIASIAEAVYSFLEARDWTESLENRIAELAQTSSSAFIRSYFDDECDEPTKMSVPDVIDTTLGDMGTFACESCGREGEFDAKDLVKMHDEYADTDFQGDLYCPECGGKAQILEYPEESYAASVSFTEVENGDTRTETVSAFEVRMDLIGTEGGEFHRGEFFERHKLRSRQWIEENCPGIQLDKPKQPSYSLRWQHALQHGLKNVKDEWNASKEQKEDDLFEVREIYLKPKKYRRFASKHVWNMRGANGETIFTMDAGETYEEAIKRNQNQERQGNPTLNLSADNFAMGEGDETGTSDGIKQIRQDNSSKSVKGICFWVCDGKIIKPPYFADFTKEYSIVQFAPDAYSAWARPFSIILSISDDVTTINTLMMLHLEKNSIANVVVDTNMFDFSDFEQDFVPTREGSNLAADGDIRRHFAVVNPPQLGGEPVNYMSFLLKISNDLSGVQPAAVGASQPGQPYAAQLLQVNQSQGLLSPYLKSKAQAKVCWFRQQLKLAQDHWSEEQFKRIESQYGAEWKEADLEAFYNADLDSDIIVTYKEGSEIPSTLQQREIKFNNFVQQVFQLAQMNPAAIRPQMIQELVGRMAGYADVSFDANNYEGERRLAQSRYERLREACRLFTEQGFSAVDPRTGESVLDEAALHIISQARVTPNPVSENHESHKEFWADHLRALSAEDEPDEILEACMGAMWGLHDKAEVTLAQMQAQNQIEAQAPMEAKQKEMQAEAEAKQLVGQTRETEAQLAEAASADEKEQAKLALEAAKHAADLEDREAERQHQKEMKQGESEPFVIG